MGPALRLPNLLSKVLGNASKVKRVAAKSGLLFCGYYTFTSQVADVFLISGPSMVPTLSEGDIVLAVPIRSIFWFFVQHFAPVSCRSLLGREDYSSIDKGDVVIAKHPAQPSLNIVKRVALLERQYIHSHHGRVPVGHAWLLSDDPALGTDSRDYGPVPLGLVHSRVISAPSNTQ
jgi:signal peptidase I